MEYGHEKATEQAQKDFLKALHINPTYMKARISLGYNLQVTLYNNVLTHKSTFWTRKEYIWPFTGGWDLCYFLVMYILPFPYYQYPEQSFRQGLLVTGSLPGDHTQGPGVLVRCGPFEPELP